MREVNIKGYLPYSGKVCSWNEVYHGNKREYIFPKYYKHMQGRKACIVVLLHFN